MSATLTPSRVILEAPPGGTASFELSLSNDDDQPLTVVAFAWDYWHGDAGRYTMPPGTTPRSAAGWLTVVPQVATLGPGEATTFIATLSVPPDAVGGYYAMLYLQSSPADSPSTAPQAQALARLGAAVAINVTGTESYDLELVGTEFTPPTVSSPALLMILATNTGNTHAPVEFRGVVRTTDGEAVSKISSGEPKYYFPGESIRLESRWTVEMEPGAYELAGTLLYGDDHVLPVVTPLIVDPAPRSQQPPP